MAENASKVKLSLFNSVKHVNKPGQITLGGLLKGVKTGRWAKQVEALRQCPPEEYHEQKKLLPGVTLSALLKNRSKNTPLKDKLIAHTGLLQVDFDHVDDLPGLRESLEHDPHVLFCFLSPGGKGLKAGVCIDPQKHETCFLAVEWYFHVTVGVRIDKSVSDVTRLMFVSHDPDLYFNEGDLLPITDDLMSKVLQTALKMIHEAGEGAKHYILLKAARLAGGAVGNGTLPVDEARQALRDAIQRKDVDDLQGAFRTIDEGLAHGMRDPLPKDDPKRQQTPPPENSPETDLPNWEFARELFPRVPFPWNALPPGVSDSLQQLARSCATSATSLPGALFAIIGSLIGRKASTSPKLSWVEPTIVWVADIRPSGAGKTPGPRLLMAPLYEEQAREHERYRMDMEVWNTLTRKEKAQAQPPPKARGYFLTDTTLEALRDDVQEHPTGGIVLVLDELSAFISGQNEYKTSGSDREAWLKLHDGNPARAWVS